MWIRFRGTHEFDVADGGRGGGRSIGRMEIRFGVLGFQILGFRIQEFRNYDLKIQGLIQFERSGFEGFRMDVHGGNIADGEWGGDRSI